ncbi:nitroreductase Nfs [Pelomyxa schiedti]|nr:nitroreductase Nfs [Pelomyxa schiedti]
MRFVRHVNPLRPTAVTLVLLVAGSVALAMLHSWWLGLVVFVVLVGVWRITLRAKAPVPVSMFSATNPITVARARQSWRSYRAEPSAQALRKLEEFIRDDDACTGPFFGSKIRIELVQTKKATKQKVGTYGFISGAKWYAVGILTSTQSPVDFGFVFEKFILLATAAGVGTYSPLQGDEKIYCVTPLGICGDDTSFFRGLMRNTVQSSRAHRKPLSELFFDASGSPLAFSALPHAFIKAAECVRIAPSAVNFQPWRVVYQPSSPSNPEARWHFFGTQSSSNHFVPNDTGIAGSHWEAVLQHEGVKGKWEIHQPCGLTAPPSTCYYFTWVFEQ